MVLNGIYLDYTGQLHDQEMEFLIDLFYSFPPAYWPGQIMQIHA